MKKSTYLGITLISVVGLLFLLILKSIQIQQFDLVIQWISIVLAFLLPTLFSETIKAEEKEKNAEQQIEDLISELKFIQRKLKDSHPIAFYLETWSYIKFVGLSDIIPHDFRKALAQAFITADAFNDASNRLEAYSLTPGNISSKTNALKMIRDDVRNELSKAVDNALSIYELMKKKGFW